MTTSDDGPLRPLPAFDHDNAPFWEAVRNHRLVLQRCGECKIYRHPPVPMCPHCGSFDIEWVPSDGRGRVYSWIVVRRPTHPFFAEVPYNVVLVQMEEGVRLFSNLLDVAPEEIRENMPVQVGFVDVEDDFTLFQFRPVESGGEC